MNNSVRHFYEFGPFRIDVENRLLLRDGELLSVTPKAVDTLVALVQHCGQVLKRDDLMKLVWSGSVVEEGNLTQNIYLLRKTLGERPDGPSYIETIPRRGYRFVGDVRQSREEAADLTASQLDKGELRTQESAEDCAERGRRDGQIDSAIATESHRTAGLTKRDLSPSPPQSSAAGIGRRWVKAAGWTAAAAVLVIGALFCLEFSAILRTHKRIGVESVVAVPIKQLSSQSENPEAYQAYLQGCYYLDNQTTRILESSVAHFQRAAILDPDYAAAYAGMADCYVLLAFQYDAVETDRREAAAKAQQEAARALKLNDQSPEAHAALGAVEQYLDADFAGAEREYRRAIELNENYAHGHHAYAILLFTLGRIDEAVAEIARAEELAPLSVSVAKNLADGYYFVRRYDEAIDQYRRAVKLDPTALEVRRDLGWAYACRGQQAEAASEFMRAMLLEDAGPERLASLRQGYNRGGLKGFWRKWLESQKGRIRTGRLDPFYLALVHAFLGDKDQALAWLQRASEERSIDPATLKFDPIFDSLRSDSRYLALLEHSGLAP